MDFKQLVDAAENWCSGNPFDLIFAEELDERRLDFYAEPGISFYVLCPDAATGGADTFWAAMTGARGAVCGDGILIKGTSADVDSNRQPSDYSMSGVKVRTACPSCRWPRTTSPPVGRRL
ncbi:maturin isoform X2 [Denticeps clupeoides]|uniref:maturin isoform X2 n=1 Tax=Denticeps clupeoides TaxID=299321 RepID=UPI0010A48A6D|nr:maturin isoform X2 [Denticeps clupeoides]